MNNLTSMLRVVPSFGFGPKGRLSSSCRKTKHLKLVYGASKRSCMLMLWLVFRPRPCWAFCFRWPYFVSRIGMRFLRISYIRSELLGLERSALVRRPRFAILMLLMPVLLVATHVGEPRLLQLRGPRDACNAMVAFYMTNLLVEV